MPTAKEFATPRRTKRFQPIVSRKYAVDASSAQWSGEPIYTQRTNPEVDLVNIRVKEPWEEDISDDSDPEEEEETKKKQSAQETLFYDAFERFAGRKSGRDLFRVGDTVTVSSNRKEPSVAVIVAMWAIRKADGTVEQSEWNMRIRIRWFLRQAELPSVRRQRSTEPNEVYFSLDAATVLTPRAIISVCSVTKSRGSNTKGSYYCAYAVQPMRGLFFNFDWESHHRRALGQSIKDQCTLGPDGSSPWDVPIPETKGRSSPNSKKKRKVGFQANEDSDSSSGAGSADEYQAPLKAIESDSDDNLPADNSDDDVLPTFTEPRTPSKSRKRKREEPVTPRTPRNKRIKAIAQPTPHSKRRLQHRPVVPKSAPSWLGGLTEKLTGDRWLRAKQMLHVGNRPAEGDEGGPMPCREEEYTRVLSCVKNLVEEGNGGCVYISGVPGTGKTATVHAIVRELKRMAQSNEVNPFTYVEINGLRLPEPPAAYTILWRGISGEEDGPTTLKMGHKESLKSLTRHFSSGGSSGPINHACVVLMDELDQLVTNQQDVVYNFFNWPTLVGSRLIVLAVANTMDLPERVMSGRVRSRLGMTRINFQPYTRQQLERIVTLRLEAAKEGLVGEDKTDVIGQDGVKLAAMKVSSVSGDARRVLDMCRRTVELVHPFKRMATAKDVAEAIKGLQNSSSAAYLKECSFHERVILAALLKVIKREGVEEVKWGDVQYQHAIYMGVLPEDDEPTRVPSSSEMGTILTSLVASRVMMMEPKRKGLGIISERKVVLGIERDEVERVLGEVGGPRWKSVLAG